MLISPVTIAPLSIDTLLPFAAAHPDWAEAAPYWILLQDAGRSRVLVAHDPGPVGMVEIVTAGAVPLLRHLEVLAAHQGRGIGTQLLAAAEAAIAAEAELAAAGAIRLQVAADNLSAAALYERCGYVDTGRRTAAEGEQQLILEKPSAHPAVP
ncbi:GNAT family N-acetyltransferase [Helcobacillus massiliensis]|uniref:GNAT family N-acetyltransferase n=1 Tax=Helcobacillus massiliensis TaxID=521392 RepID=UPI0021A44678|nr:GNAT family N-acetyltransferase [Helcobacillus massiliensis]MCT1558490.1 GNAT family N-acetyltransferase [Helcobacillus massiliensis]MCT2037260.1 GNAT family N-acetyltransferase [Helcobacillus massiliensis]MCT2332057.1 GNAT family N-acetyltransferase [Helcobacillus massiliensis]